MNPHHAKAVVQNIKFQEHMGTLNAESQLAAKRAKLEKKHAERIPTRSLLPNSSPDILQPMSGEGGTFQVQWFPEADSHGLLFVKDGAVQLLATHHNGYSCHALAQRILSGNLEHATQQLEFIRACGGTAIASLEQFKR